MKKFGVLLVLSTLLVGCQRHNVAVKTVVKENVAAKRMLQGVWINEDEDYPTFRIKGDTIYYPDSTSIPVYFRIVNDTLMLSGDGVAKYPIVRQGQHFFVFKNQAGELVSLVKTSDKAYLRFFQTAPRARLNQRQLIKRDSVVMIDNGHYHYYVQVNPTSYRVVKKTYNDDGVEVGSVFYDNIVHVSLFHGNQQVFSHDFRKNEFASEVPEQVLEQGILSDIVFMKADTEEISFTALICIPDSPISYQVAVIVDTKGKLKMKVF